MATQYKLYTNSTGSANGVASLKITRKGKIRAVNFALDLLGGAGLGRYQFELSKQNSSSLTVNDTPQTVIASAGIASPNAAHAAENALVVCNVDVDIGDTLYLNEVFTGAAAATGLNANVYVYTE